MKLRMLDNDQGPLITDNVIRIQLRRPKHREWELSTRNCSPGKIFPTIQLFDCDGNLLIETNDDNLSIKSTDVDKKFSKRHSKSLGATDFTRRQATIRKNNSISGDTYTRLFKRQHSNSTHSESENDENNLRIPPYKRTNSSPLSFNSPAWSECSSFKSSDNESALPSPVYDYVTAKPGTLLLETENPNKYPNRRRRNPEPPKNFYSFNGLPINELQKSPSYHKPKRKWSYKSIRRANTDIIPTSKKPTCPVTRNMSFLDTYMKSLPSRNKEVPGWLSEITRHVELRDKAKDNERSGDDETDVTTQLEKFKIDKVVEEEIRRRLKKYHRVLSCSDYWTWKKSEVDLTDSKRRNSEGGGGSSSDSFDESDKVLMRLRRRILQNKKREKKEKQDKSPSTRQRSNTWQSSSCVSGVGWCGGGSGEDVLKEKARGRAMGGTVGRHRNQRGLAGRRAQSSGDLCAGTENNRHHHDACSIAGSTATDVPAWNSSRSLPSHLDGRRRCPCGECGLADTSHCSRAPSLPTRRRKYTANLDPVWKLQDPGCDQGYGSERSPEEEYPPAMVPEAEYDENEEIDLRQIYPFITDDNTFTVRIEKDRRGLGLSVTGGAGLNGGPGLIRIRRLYASQPAWSSGQLRPGDILLAANGISLAGLTTYEALEVLRTTPPVVELVVCRPEPELMDCMTPPGEPPEPPLRQPTGDPLNLHPPRSRQQPPPSPQMSVPEYEEPQPVYDVKFGEFDIVMTKVNGSLGFTLRKEDHSALGHYVRALVREPALSDGRIQPGDRIVAVNDVPMSTLSHGEAVSFLRRCGPVARLRLYRDNCGTPPSPCATSPTTESDSTFIKKPKTPLRQEAVNMLCDIAARKLTADDGNGSRSPGISPRRYKKFTRNSTGCSQNSDTKHPYSVVCPSTTAENSDNELSQSLSYQSTDTTTNTADTTYSVIQSNGRPDRPTCFNGNLFDNATSKSPARPDFLDLGGPPTPVNYRKQRLHFSVAAHGYELNNLDNDVLDAPNIYLQNQNGGTGYLPNNANHQLTLEMSNEPISMPIELITSSDGENSRFTHKNPAYQSAVIHPSSNHLQTNNANELNRNDVPPKKTQANYATLEKDKKTKQDTKHAKDEPHKPKIMHYPDENRPPGSEPRIVTVELNRGWNSRLGFSVQCNPDTGQSFISAIYSDSVAAKDGRLRQGDIILQVNDENITSMTTPQVIDLLRIIRGSICITVLRQ